MKSRLVAIFTCVMFFVLYIVSAFYLNEEAVKIVQSSGVTPTIPNYFPLIMRQFTPTPTPTLTPTPTNTPTATPPVTTLQNGNFDQGPNVGWQQYSSNGWEIIIHSSDLPINPRSGNWVAWLGGDNDEISVIWQEVTIPNSNSNLRFWYWIASEDLCGYDFGGVVVDNTVADVFDLCNDQNTGGWIQRTVNLGAYAGQTVALEIRVETDSSLNSNLFVDDVTLGGSQLTMIEEVSIPQEVDTNLMLSKLIELQTHQQINPPYVLSRVWEPVEPK